jgi:hypothetical protein
MSTEDRTADGETLSRSLNRRSFLKLGGMGTALPLASQPAGIARGMPLALERAQPSDSRKEALPAIPKPADLASDRLVHHFRDHFNPPQAQNELGFLRAHKSVSAMTTIAFPPYTCCGVPEPAVTDSLITCEMFLDGQILANYPPPAGEVAYTWYTHKILRETRVAGLLFTTETFMPSKQRVAVQAILVKNESAEHRKFTLSFNLRAGVAVTQPWRPRAETDNRITPDASRGCLIFESRKGQAVSVQGILPRPARIEQGRMLVHEFSLGPGDSQRLQYLNVVDNNTDAALGTYDHLQGQFDELVGEHEQGFGGLLRSAFTPGNSDFSGNLPQLHTNHPLLWKLYYMGFAGLLFCRRVSPDSVYGPTYITCTRGTTHSWIWDTMLTSLSLALLDPKALRSLLEVWLTLDMHQATATDYLTGQRAGLTWGYAVNDMGILRCAHDYLRVTGDFAWLDKKMEGKPVIERLLEHALYWKKLVKRSDGLADYGDLRNLLEVVSTYVHEVAAMNAGNVYGMRFVAALLERRGDASQAAQLRSEAKELAARINRLLYVEGKGWWKAGQPDGTYLEVRHCYDLLTIFDTMFKDLSDGQKKEMSSFFWTELYTPLWMHALSPWDVDASWNVRADHSWLGAYLAWPSMTAKGLYKVDPSARVAAWVKGLARTANQGPYAQAHIVESVFPPESGGAMKSPLEKPYDNDWAVVSGGSYTDMVIDSVFGADLTLFDGIRVKSRLVDFDPEAKLSQVSYQGKRYTITQHAVSPAE